MLSPGVKDASVSLHGVHKGNSTHESYGPDLSRASLSLLLVRSDLKCGQLSAIQTCLMPSELISWFSSFLIVTCHLLFHHCIAMRGLGRCSFLLPCLTVILWCVYSGAKQGVSTWPSGDEELGIGDQQKSIDTKFRLIIYWFEPREL